MNFSFDRTFIYENCSRARNACRVNVGLLVSVLFVGHHYITGGSSKPCNLQMLKGALPVYSSLASSFVFCSIHPSNGDQSGKENQRNCSSEIAT